MRRSTAAAYLDMSAAEFDRQVAIGTLPLAFRLGKYEYWSRARIDEHMALAAGEAPADPDATDWRKGHPLYADAGDADLDRRIIEWGQSSGRKRRPRT